MLGAYPSSMPRGPRLDAPGALHHVIARGIERGAIFRNDGDRSDFLERLAVLLRCCDARLYAWALIPNHFHLLVRTGTVPLSSLLRRLLTGYAVSFNRRHRRAGHLFQNRFKSILVEEEAYLLALVRYIHLNPLRACLIDSVDALAHYPWSGHAVLLGNRILPEQDAASVLAYFGSHPPASRQAYLRFVAEAVGVSHPTDLSGGGLRRSLGWRDVAVLERGRERWAFDERVLGSGAFVEQVIAQLTPPEPPLRRLDARSVVEALCSQYAAEHGVCAAEICSRSLRRAALLARTAVCRAAVTQHGLSATQVARLLGISVQSVLRATLPRLLARGAAVPVRSGRR
jgi:putative transposase